MALGYLDDSKLYAIASAIRAKTGDSATMSVDDMPDEIGSISTGAQVEPLSVTENGTYSAPTGYAYSPVTVNVSGGGGITADQVATRTISGAVAGSATSVARYAFYDCASLTAASFPNATAIGSNAFYSCHKLTTASFPNATTIGSYAFATCSQLTAASFPKATSTGNYAFASCSQLTAASFPNATAIGSNAFSSCLSLATVSFPNAKAIGSNAFYSCRKLTTVSFPAVTSIYTQAFRGCLMLVELHLEGISSVPLLTGANHFSSTPIGGYSTSAGQYGSVFVPASLYNAFLTATNWSSISSRIVSVS